jgi:hypothetical protein
MVDYLVADNPIVKSAEDLTAILNNIGTQGWELSDSYLRRYAQRRNVFVASDPTDYLVVDYPTGKTPQDLEQLFDSYGADGWVLKHIDLMMQNKRRAIFMRVGGGGGGTITRSAVFQYSTSNSPPPTSGHILINNDDPSLASYVYISNLTGDGTDVSTFLAALKVNDKIYIQNQGDASNYYQFNIAAVPEPAVDYVAFQVAFEKRAGADLVKNSDLLVVMGTPGAGGSGGGISEAPTDGITYGRKDMVWNPTLALNNDVLDGGNF